MKCPGDTETFARGYVNVCINVFNKFKLLSDDFAHLLKTQFKRQSFIFASPDVTTAAAGNK